MGDIARGRNRDEIMDKLKDNLERWRSQDAIIITVTGGIPEVQNFPVNRKLVIIDTDNIDGDTPKDEILELIDEIDSTPQREMDLCIRKDCEGHVIGSIIDVDGRYAFQQSHCNECGLEWVDEFEYRITGGIADLDNLKTKPGVIIDDKAHYAVMEKDTTPVVSEEENTTSVVCEDETPPIQVDKDGKVVRTEITAQDVYKWWKEHQHQYFSFAEFLVCESVNDLGVKS